MESEIVATSGVSIPAGTSFTSLSTGEVYTTVDLAESDGSAYLNLIASTAGENGNLALGEVLQIGTPIAGAASTATIISDVYTDGVVTAGADIEKDPVYRRRILTKIRARGGGGNSSDYRTWAESVADVARAFPYSGKPYELTVNDTFAVTADGLITYTGEDEDFTFEETLGVQLGDLIKVEDTVLLGNSGTFEVVALTEFIPSAIEVDFAFTEAEENMTISNLSYYTSYPGDRTVYIESVSTGPDATPETIAAARSALLTDPTTGKSRVTVGAVDSQLWVLSTTAAELRVYIIGLFLPAEMVADAQAKIASALTDYCARVAPFVDGLDYPGDRSDFISRMSVSTVIQGILRGFGGTAESIHIDIDELEDVDLYQLEQGQLLKMALTTPIVYGTEWPIP
jgi:hypothetical protein